MPGTPHEQRDLLAHFLAARDVPCPSCGYNLRDLQSSACPECGQPLNVRLDAIDPRSGRYLACVLPLGGAASVMIAILGTVLPQMVRLGSYGNKGEQMLFKWYPAGVALAALIALCLLIRRRGRAWFHAGSGSARTMLAVLCVTASAGCVVAWVLWFQWMMFS